MPREIELLERFVAQYRKALRYLDENDKVTIKASLNLNPLITDWNSSEIKPQYFIDKFNQAFEGIPNINEIVTDTSLMGTTQQKRESLDLPYDQFIFVDTDIAFPEQLLKCQLEASYQLDGMYVLIPQLVKLWDYTWDVLVHNDYLNEPYGYYNTHDPNITYQQQPDEVFVETCPVMKFGCGMHTLYSKSFWQFVGIPKSFGGYGSEDTFAMFASTYAKQKGYNIEQYILKGLYITEDMINRVPSFDGKIKTVFSKDESRDASWRVMQQELNEFSLKI
jgi:hypothetical protein